jgi:hypothetical protein
LKLKWRANPEGKMENVVLDNFGKIAPTLSLLGQLWPGSVNPGHRYYR